LAGGVAASTTSYESIATVTVGTAVSSISFSSIPSTFKHLQIRGIARTSRTSSGQATLRFRVNGDDGSNYSYHRLFGDGSSLTASGEASQSYGYFYFGATTSDTSNIFGASVWDVLDYSNTSKYKTLRILGGLDTNGGGGVGIGSASWQSTSAISGITLSIDGGFNFNQYSSFALYGIKG
jgi:hypothetical protein